MNKRQRKNWLKKHNKYVNPAEIWSLDMTIAEFIVPRLKMLKDTTHTYPGCGDADTPEKWRDILEQMIYAFETHLDLVNLADKYFPDEKADLKLIKEDNKKVEEGLLLFAKWFPHLWD